MNVIGDVNGHAAVIIDDEMDTAGSLLEAVGALEASGARAIYSCATHGVFCADALDRVASFPITEIVVTDTVPLPHGVDDPRTSPSSRSLRSSERRSSASITARASGPSQLRGPACRR